ncbi:MAG: hypothetical protein K0U47_05980 [Epsilonproteobacteria bacterium]|nr:hypothetical protein [Campylobacterota bacterium]
MQKTNTTKIDELILRIKAVIKRANKINQDHYFDAIYYNVGAKYKF